jgi:hypothetical protein
MALYDREQHSRSLFSMAVMTLAFAAKCTRGWPCGSSDSRRPRSNEAAPALRLPGISCIRTASSMRFTSQPLAISSVGTSKRYGDLAESMIGISVEHGFQQWLAFGKVLDSWVLTKQGCK